MEFWVCNTLHFQHFWESLLLIVLAVLLLGYSSLGPSTSTAGAQGLGTRVLLGMEGAVRNAFRRRFTFILAIPQECRAVGSEGHSCKSGWDRTSSHRRQRIKYLWPGLQHSHWCIIPALSGRNINPEMCPNAELQERLV